MTADPTPDLAALIEEMTAKAECILARGNNCRHCDGYGNVNIMQAGVVQGRLTCEWCGGDQYADIDEARNVLALLAAYKAMTERAEAAKRGHCEVDRETARWVEKAAEITRTAGERVAELEGSLRETATLAAKDGGYFTKGREAQVILGRAARLLSPPKDASGETTGAP